MGFAQTTLRKGFPFDTDLVLNSRLLDSDEQEQLLIRSTETSLISSLTLTVETLPIFYATFMKTLCSVTLSLCLSHPNETILSLDKKPLF